MTHGRGKKAGRGAGLRGGRGNAGLLKHRWMHMVKYMPDHFGRHGFKRPQSIIKKAKTINVGELEERFPDKKVINLTEEGFNKLLGGGEITTKLKITVDSASEKAIEKIKGKGGEVIVPEPEFTEQETVEEAPVKEEKPVVEPVEEKTVEEEKPVEEPIEESEEKPSKDEKEAPVEEKQEKKK
jgi:large subunit ribosomal protein L15